MKSLSVILAMLLASGAYAADLTEQLQQCRAIDVELKRLACYDKIDAATPDVSPVPTPTAVAVPTPTAVAVTNTVVEPVADFGLEKKRVEQAIKEVDTLSLELKSVKTNKLGLMIFTFTNGQVWRQSSKEFFYSDVGASFQIKRGLFGAFYLSKKGANRTTKVIREQ